MSELEYPVILVEEGDISGLSLCQSQEVLACFVEEFADCLDEFMIFDRTGRRLQAHLVAKEGMFGTGIDFLARERLRIVFVPNDSPNDTRLLEIVNALAQRRCDQLSFTSILDALEYLESLWE